VIALASAVLGVNCWAARRTLDELGLAELTLSELDAILQ
jgi:hypothetical protein